MSKQDKSKTPPEEKNLWRTPDNVITRVNNRYGAIDVDAAADADNKKANRWLGPGSPWGEDALEPLAYWGAGLKRGTARVFVNPPFSPTEEQADPIPRFIRKAITQVVSGEVRQVVLLVPASVDVRWFHQLVWDERRNGPRDRITVDLLPGRVRYLRPDGTLAGTPQWGSMLVVVK